MTEQIKKTLRDSPTARWAALILVSATMFFAYFFVDMASPIKNQLELAYSWTSEMFGFYAGAEFSINVFFAFLIFAGIILDKKGIRFSLILSSSLMVIGALIKFYGIQFVDRQLMVGVFGSQLPQTLVYSCVGFAIFGMGAEMAGITVSKTIVKWFKGKELALAMGLEMAIARLGVFAVMILSPILANNQHTEMSRWTTSNVFLWGTIFLLIGFVCFFIYTIMDVKLDKETAAETANNKEEAEPEESFKISDLGKLFSNPGFLTIAGLCVLFYSAIFPFQRFATEMLVSKLFISPALAAIYVSIFPIGALVLTPIIGIFLDKFGKGATMMVFGSVLLTISHLIFALVPSEYFTPFIAIATIVVLGTAFSLVPASMWPSVPKIVEERYLGSAYGSIFWIQNIGLMLVPILIGSVLDSSNPTITKEALEAGAFYDYTMPELVFAGFGVMAILLSLVLKATDKKKGYGLDKPNIRK